MIGPHSVEASPLARAHDPHQPPDPAEPQALGESSPPPREDRRQRALELSFRYLNRRERTAGEVRGHLRAKDLDDATIDETIATLAELGTLDDARFARVFAEDKRTLEQWGAERIERALHERGVDRDLVEAALAAVSEGESELARALDVLRRRFSEPPRDRRDRERALGVLLRKGYDNDTALEALRTYAHGAG